MAARRALGIAVALFLVLGSVAARLWYLQIRQAAHYQSLAQRDYLRQIPVIAPRGNIVTSDGTVLADSVPGWELEYLDPTVDGAMPPKELDALSVLLGTSPIKLDAVINQALHRQYSYQPVVLDPNQSLTPKQITTYEEERTRFPNLHLFPVPVRQYPQGATFGNFIGYLNESPRTPQELAQSRLNPNTLFGADGLEASYQNYLAGQQGTQIVEVDQAGDIVKLYGQKPATAGDTLHLTINWNLEMTATNALAYVMHAMQTTPLRYGGGPYSPTATQGAVIVTDPQNGDILAIASLPSYNPQLISYPASQAAINQANSEGAFYNNAIMGQFAPGSIFKPIIAGGALASGTVTPSTIVDDIGYFSLDPAFKNWYPPGFGPQDMVQAIEHSDDTYFYWVGYWMGIQKMDQYIKLYGLDTTTGIDVPGEAASVMPTPALLAKTQHVPWTWGYNLDTVIGQGLSGYTLIGLARAEAAVANGGTLYWPHLGSYITAPGGKVVKVIQPKVQAKTGFQPWIYDVIHQGMEMSAQDPTGTGYGAMAGIPMYVATKTGTAQKANGTVNDAFFTSFAPANPSTYSGSYPAPQIDVVVWIHDGVFGSYSGFVARAVYDQFFHLKDPGAKTLFDQVYGANYAWPFGWTGQPLYSPPASSSSSGT
jgi:penicillin-binding protein 2